MFLLVTYHTIKNHFQDHPHIDIYADIAQLIVYIITLILIFRARHPTKGWKQWALTLAALIFPEMFVLHVGLTKLLTGDDSVFAPRTMDKETYDAIV